MIIMGPSSPGGHSVDNKSHVCALPTKDGGDDSSEKARWSGGCLPALTGLRALAALVVVLAHYDGSGGTLGQLGVQLFFVLSAYLMCLLYLTAPRGKTAAMRSRYAATFLYNRMARILPLALMVIFVSYVLQWAPTPLTRSYAIYAKGVPLVDMLTLRAAPGIMWTITVEFAFYNAFAALLVLPPRAARTIIRTIIACAVMGFIVPPTVRFEDLTGITWGLITEKAYVYKFFALGALCFELHLLVATVLSPTMRRVFGTPPAKRTSVVEMLAMFGASALLVGATLLRCYIWHNSTKWNHWNDARDALLLCALLLGSLFLAPIRIALLSYPMQHLGNISYSLYLTHMFVFKYFSIHSRRDGSALSFAFFIAANVAISTVSFYTIEQPTMKCLRRRGARSMIPDWVNLERADTNIACGTRSAESALKSILPLLSADITPPATKSNVG